MSGSHRTAEEWLEVSDANAEARGEKIGQQQHGTGWGAYRARDRSIEAMPQVR